MRLYDWKLFLKARELTEESIWRFLAAVKLLKMLKGESLVINIFKLIIIMAIGLSLRMQL